MKVLIIKTSSMGDVLHTLPALTDAGKIFPNIQFDWVVEENFSEIPAWHPLVKKVIPVALRRWRKNLRNTYKKREWEKFYNELREQHYDYVIDAQGLIKSAFLTRLSRGRRCGLNWNSAREPLASLMYQRRYNIHKEQHAIDRVRQLFAKALGYSVSQQEIDYGLNRQKFQQTTVNKKYVVFLHGTTWETKKWPEPYWRTLAKQVNDAGYVVKLPWGNQEEYLRAQAISIVTSQAEVLPKLNLNEMAKVIANAKAVIAVDTGLAHLAAALAVPTITLYGSTDPKLIGTYGKNQKHLRAKAKCAPCLNKTCNHFDENDGVVMPICFKTLSPSIVFKELREIIEELEIC